MRLDELERFEKDYLRKYRGYQAAIIEQWGQAESSNQRQFVQYSDNYRQKIVVDYENNQIRVEQLASDLEPKPDLTTLAKKAASLTVEQAAGSDPVFPVRIADRRSILESAFPGSLMDFPSLIAKSHTKVKKRDLSSAAESVSALQAVDELPAGSPPEAAATARSTVTNAFKEARKKSARNTRIYSLTIQFPANSALQRAKPYADVIEQNAKNFDLEVALVLAITQTESYFNPNAKSLVPAFGLMQVVPGSAGLDVNQQINQVAELPTPESLFDSGINIAYGTGYLYLLSHRYFKDVYNPSSRLYCVIAAYNTGIGNVAKVFTSNREAKLTSAVEEINSLSANAVYARLLSGLPYEETKRYLKKVTEARSKWAAVRMSGTEGLHTIETTPQ